MSYIFLILARELVLHRDICPVSLFSVPDQQGLEVGGDCVHIALEWYTQAHLGRKRKILSESASCERDLTFIVSADCGQDVLTIDRVVVASGVVSELAQVPAIDQEVEYRTDARQFSD